MEIRENGVLRAATAEEEEEIRRGLEHAESAPAVPTTEERIAHLEEELAALKILTGEAQ